MEKENPQTLRYPHIYPKCHDTATRNSSRAQYPPITPEHRANGPLIETICPRRNNTTRVLYPTLYSKLPPRRTPIAIVTIKSALSHERGWELCTFKDFVIYLLP
eukprot:scaffold103940_cov48-Attheya_sp.AAC.1